MAAGGLHGEGRAAPLLQAGPHCHHYQAVLETGHHPMLPSKMAMATPNWVWGPPAEVKRGLMGVWQPEVEPHPLRVLRWEAQGFKRGPQGYGATQAPSGGLNHRVTPALSAHPAQFGHQLWPWGRYPRGARMSCPQEAGGLMGQEQWDPPSRLSQGKPGPQDGVLRVPDERA